MTDKKLTNEQAINVLDVLWCNPLFSEPHRQAFEMGIKAIKALEQEDAIEKIRAKVESINLWALRYAPTYDEDIRPQIVSNVKEHVLEIIDKYREDT